MANYIVDHQAENWWATISGAGTGVSGIDPSWADDYTRHRSTLPIPNSTTYSGITEFDKHTGANQPADLYIGRVKTGRELDIPKLFP